MRNHFYLLPYPLSYHRLDGIFSFMANYTPSKNKTPAPKPIDNLMFPLSKNKKSAPSNTEASPVNAEALPARELAEKKADAQASMSKPSTGEAMAPPPPRSKKKKMAPPPPFLSK